MSNGAATEPYRQRLPPLAVTERMHKLTSIEQLAQSLLARHLPGWQFCFNRQRRTLGLCRYREQRIELSRHHAEMGNMAQARETLIHDIAHGLAGPRTGHGPKWQRIMRELGATPSVTARTDYDLDDYKWALVRREANDLHWIAGRYRRPRHCDRLVLRGRPDTLGSVHYCAYTDYLSWQAGDLALTELALYQ